MELALEIITGRLAAGDVLPPEPELAREFEISKVVVRECIQELAGYGLLRVQHGKRTTVLEQSEWHVLSRPVQEAYRLAGAAWELTNQAYDVRQVLEMNAVAWAAVHGEAAHLEELDFLVDAMRLIAQDSREVPEFLIKDRAFHDVIGRATGNMVLRAMMRDLHNLLALNWTNSRTTSAQLEALAEQHADIAAAVRARDPAAARQAMELHLCWAKDVETQRADAQSSRPLAPGASPGVRNHEQQ